MRMASWARIPRPSSALPTPQDYQSFVVSARSLAGIFSALAGSRLVLDCQLMKPRREHQHRVAHLLERQCFHKNIAAPDRSRPISRAMIPRNMPRHGIDTMGANSSSCFQTILLKLRLASVNFPKSRHTIPNITDIHASVADNGCLERVSASYAQQYCSRNMNKAAYLPIRLLFRAFQSIADFGCIRLDFLSRFAKTSVPSSNHVRNSIIYQSVFATLPRGSNSRCVSAHPTQLGSYPSHDNQ